MTCITCKHGLINTWIDFWFVLSQFDFFFEGKQIEQHWKRSIPMSETETFTVSSLDCWRMLLLEAIKTQWLFVDYRGNYSTSLQGIGIDFSEGVQSKVCKDHKRDTVQNTTSNVESYHNWFINAIKKENDWSIIIILLLNRLNEACSVQVYIQLILLNLLLIKKGKGCTLHLGTRSYFQLEDYSKCVQTISRIA